MHFKFIITPLLISAITLALTACAGSSSSSSTQPPQETEEIAVTSSVSQEVARRTQNGGRIVIIITGPDGYRREEPATLDANNKINLAVTVPRLATGAYRITIELRDPMGSIIAAASQDATAGSPTALNVTNPIFGIPQRGQMTLIWDNKIDAPSFLIRWESIDAGPKNRQIEGAAKNTTSQYIIRNLTDASFYTFTVYAKHIQGVINLATYQFAGSPGPNNDNDTQNDLVDPDDDNDGVRDRTPDNCPFTYNPAQRNIDNDGRGDACDADDDNDGITDTDDNCPTAPNPTQANTITPENPLGDACDDRDNDGLVDADDPCPTITEPCFYINNITDLHAIPDNAAAIYYLNTSLTNADRPAINNFMGTFDGRGNTISGLANPLFHTITSDATVTNIGILGSTLAIRNAGSITHAYATGNSRDHAIRDPSVVDSTEFYHSGGLVALNLGRINASYATGNATCPTTPFTRECYSGGLVGWNQGNITNAYATGDSDATGGSCSSGGLVGFNVNIIRYAYATGESSSAGRTPCHVGGLVGRIGLGSTITASYRVQSSGTDDGDRGSPQTLDELRGASSYTGWSNATWNFGTATDLPTLRSLDSDGDGFANTVDNCPTVPNPDQANDITDNNSIGDACDDPDGDMVYDISDNCPYAANPTQANNYGNLSNSAGTGDACEDTDNDGRIDISDNCPTVVNPDQADRDGDDYGNVCDAFPRDATEQTDTDGDGTGDNADSCPTDPNRDCQGIATDEDLIDLLNGIISDDGYYRLTDDITISAGAGWAPISDFRGTLNGNNHTITFTTPQPNQPLFDSINATATVTRIGIINSTLAHRNDGNISYAYATGDSTGSILSINGFLYTISGGLVDYNSGNITASYATGNSNGGSSGGLVDYNSGNITASYATGNSTCDSGRRYCFSGGLVGFNSGGTITASYATGNSTCTGRYCDSGGLVGYNTGTITASYATGNSTCPSRSCRSGGLVGSTGSSGTITNAYATGNSTCTGIYCDSGGLVGSIGSSGTITNAYATGNSMCVSRIGCNSGGLVGYNWGTITTSYATGHGRCTGAYCRFGGLVGWNLGNITASYATGNSRCTGDSCDSGGLVGINFGTLTINNSYATGNSRCTGENCDSGGLVGWNDGLITASYATGNSRCTGDSCDSGGLVGSIGSSGTITASYRVQSSGTDGGDGDTPQTLAQLREAPSYSGWMTPPWDFGTTTELPRHHRDTGIPFCPGATDYSDTSCRW